MPSSNVFDYLISQGCRPVGGSASASPCSSYQPSPHTSYNPSPASSSFPSPVSSSYAAPTIIPDGNSLIPWLRNLSSSSSSASSSNFIHHYMHSGSISAPVTPPSSSPTARTPKTDWAQHPFLPLSTPPSPGHPVHPAHSKWYDGVHIPPTSPTFSLVSSNPFGFRVEDMSRGGSFMCTPGQSGTCSPAVGPASDIPMAEMISNEFAFGSNVTGLVKPWEGERIHEECGSDELELTLGSSKTR